jgi:hypothetical protein
MRWRFDSCANGHTLASLRLGAALPLARGAAFVPVVVGLRSCGVGGVGVVLVTAVAHRSVHHPEHWEPAGADETPHQECR